MRFRLKPVVAGLCLLGVMNVPAFAAVDTNGQQEAIIQKLNDRTVALESELKELRSEIKQLRAEKQAVQKHTALVKQTKLAQKSEQGGQNSAAGKVGQNVQREVKETQLPQNIVYEQPSSIATGGPTAQPLYFLSKTPLYLGGSPVVVSPLVGLYSDADVNDLIVNMPSVNEDLRLLRQRQQIAGLYDKFGLPAPDQPIVDLSGRVEGQIMGTRPYAGHRRSDVDLSGAEIDVAALVNSWATGFISINYDNSPPPPGTGRSVDNSRFFVSKAFISIGDLIKSPVYFTIGQFFVPFGQYGSYMISSPLTEAVGRIKARAVLLGYNKVFSPSTTINGSLFAFRGDSASNDASNINQFGANLDYTFHHGDKVSGDLAVSYIANIADSEGMQSNGGPGVLSAGGAAFTGFATTSPATELLAHKVPGFDARGGIAYGDFSVMAEYVTAAEKFSPLNMTFNSGAAKPMAFHVESVYNFTAWGKKSLVAVGYDVTKDALALLLPKQRYVAVLSTSFWDWTIESLEFRHDINYGAGDFATGQGLPIVPLGLGHASDTVTFQIGIYF